MPTPAQLFDAFIDAQDRDHLEDADLCVTALRLSVDAKFAIRKGRRR
jgi:hypothetical protein